MQPNNSAGYIGNHQWVNNINQQHQHHSDSIKADNALSVGMLFSDRQLMQWLEQLVGFNQSPPLLTQVIDSNPLQLGPIQATDLLLIDAEFAIAETVLLEQALENLPPATPCILILQEHQLPLLMPQLAHFARAGVDQFVLHHDLNLRLINQALENGAGSQNHQGLSYTSNLTSKGATNNHESDSARTDARRISDQTSADLSLSVQRSQQTAEPNTQGIHEDCNHQLTIDLSSQRVHLDAVDLSPVCAEDDLLMDFDSWLARLSQDSIEQMNALIDSATHYQPIPRTLFLEMQTSTGQWINATLDNIQLKNNGQGRVIGASGNLCLHAPQGDPMTGDAPDVRAGFDNLCESVDFIEAEKIWHNVTRSLPMQCLLLDEEGFVARLLNEGDHSNTLLPQITERAKLSELLSIDSLDDLTETISRTLNTGKPHHQVIAYQSSQGLRWLDTHITRLRGDSGLARQVLWTAFDITSSRHAYQELLKSRDSIAQILENSPLLFFQKDNAGRYLRANQKFCELFDVNEQSIASHSDQEVFADAHSELQQLTLDALAQETDTDGMISSCYSETLGDKTLTFYWQTLLNRRANDNQLDSLCGFGVILDDASLQSIAGNVPADSGDKGNSDEPISSIDPQSKLTMSGALQQDSKLIVETLTQYAELAQQQKNPTRTQHIADFLQQIETTARHSQQSLQADEASTQTDTEQKARTETAKAIQLEPIVSGVIDSLDATSKASISFTATPAAAQSQAQLDADAFQQIVERLLNTDTASAPVKNERSGQIGLSLETITPSGQRCIACDEPLNSEYLALSVETNAPGIDEAGLQRLIDSTRQNTQSDADHHVVALAHRQQGHALIEKQDDKILLKLLFHKA